VPKKIEELANAKKNYKRKTKKIDFQPIAKKIIESGLYYTVTEVWSRPDLVNKQVSRFRVMKLLNNQVRGRRMIRLYQNGKFYYGRPTN